MDLTQTVRTFVDAFSREDLDAVMAMFAEDASYHTFEGKLCEGKAAIRAEFEPQFRRAYGRLEFIEEQLVVDEQRQIAAVSWWCRHDLQQVSSKPMERLAGKALKLLFGAAPGWQGVDLLQFRDGLIVSKRTYARSPLPLVKRRPAPGCAAPT